MTDENLPAPRFERTFRLPNGTTFTVPFVAGQTRNAAGAATNINVSRPNPSLGSILVNRSIGQTW